MHTLAVRLEIFATTHVVLSHVPKPSRWAMTLAFGVAATGYSVGSLGLLVKLIKGDTHTVCCKLELTIWAVLCMHTACALA